MKKYFKYLLLAVVIILATGCGKSVEKIGYSKLEEMLNNKETFILEIVQDGCHNCESFEPKFEKILKKYNLNAKMINLTSLSKEENNKLSSLYNISGTPTVIFVEKGEEVQISKRIVGDVSKDKVINKLKVAGYIK